MNIHLGLLKLTLALAPAAAAMEHTNQPEISEQELRAKRGAEIDASLATAGNLLFALWRQDNAAFLRATTPIVQAPQKLCQDSDAERSEQKQR